MKSLLFNWTVTSPATRARVSVATLLPHLLLIGHGPAAQSRRRLKLDAANGVVVAEDTTLEIRVGAMLLVRLATEVDALGPLPSLDTGEEQNGAHENDAPLPGDGSMLEHLSVEDGNVGEREDGHEADDDGEEQELVAPGIPEPLSKVLLALGLHAEEGASHVDHFPGEKEREPGECGETGSAGAVHGVAAVGIIVVAVHAKVTVAPAEHDEQEGRKAKGGGPETVDEHVEHELPGEDANLHLFELLALIGQITGCEHH